MLVAAPAKDSYAAWYNIILALAITAASRSSLVAAPGRSQGVAVTVTVAVRHAVSQSVRHAVSQSVRHAVSQSVRHAVSQSVSQSDTQSVSQSDTQSVSRRQEQPSPLSTTAVVGVVCVGDEGGS